ncbi:MAG TPA: hypothetical protein VM073_12350 [Usitatibacter sp.]|nr:hypothetical protein [Usitatibacter sp.]
MRRLLVLLFFLGAIFPASAQEPRKYAVLSLLGDALLVVQRELTTGTHIDRNTRTVVAVNTPALDHSVLLAIDREIGQAEPAAKTVLLAARKPELFAAQSRALDAGVGLASVLEAVKPVVAPANATHLVLVTKHRGEARLEMADGFVGAGRLEGLGFYIDPTKHVENRDTGARAEGFIAPFAYFQVSLVDLRDGRTIREQVVTASRAQASQQAATPWLAMTPEEKVGLLDWLIRTEAERAVPRLLRR